MKKDFILCDRRIATMKQRLGQAVELIDGEQFLGVFRNRQINHTKEFEASVKMVKSMERAGKIRDAKRYFAKIWSREKLSETLRIMREFLNRQLSKLAEKREQARRNFRNSSIQASKNEEGLKRFELLKRQYNLS